MQISANRPGAGTWSLHMDMHWGVHPAWVQQLPTPHTGCEHAEGSRWHNSGAQGICVSFSRVPRINSLQTMPIRQGFLPSNLQSNIKGLMRLALGVIAGHTADKAHDAHAQEAVIGLSSPDGHPVMQPCVPVSRALLHLLCGQQDCQPPRSLRTDTIPCFRSLGTALRLFAPSQLAGESRGAHVQEVYSGLGCPNGHPVMQPCFPVSCSLLLFAVWVMKQPAIPHMHTHSSVTLPGKV